ncbi:MAG: hypothetical protein KGH64_06560 [Candidatus Micrarchaeota archaeon]|nr:hypothetical protein [Candidatus Micrarchaeota archaeon]
MKFGEIIQVNAVVIAGILILAGIDSLVKTKYFLLFYGETWTLILMSVIASIIGILIEEGILIERKWFLKSLKVFALGFFAVGLFFLFESIGLGISK